MWRLPGRWGRSLIPQDPHIARSQPSATRRACSSFPSILDPEVPVGGIRVCFSGREIPEPLCPELVHPQARLPVRMPAKAD